MRTVRGGLLAVLSALLVVACGDGGGNETGDDPTAQPTEACGGDHDGPIVAVDTDTTGTDGQVQVYVVQADGSFGRITGDWVASQPGFSPDGERVVVVRADGDYESAGPNSTALWVMGVDGSDPQAATSGDVLDEGPDWSPDGDRILFTRARRVPDGYRWSIEVVSPDGGEPTTLHDAADGVLGDVTWSPDGQRIAFVHTTFADDTRTNRTAVWTMGADGRDPQPLVDMSVSGSLDWSPDGRSLLVTGGDQSTLHQIDVDSGGATSLADHVDLAAWAPDGDSIYYLENPDDVGVSALAVLRVGHVEDGRLVADGDVPIDVGEIDPSFSLATAPCA